jgi:aerobic-type carbon monoxide dehydrogenase small subunit (CoxS/CutS family)
VQTVEGLENDDGSLHPVQEAFAKHHALQCGFCTPGFLMTAIEMIAEGLEPDAAVIRQRISGNLCRCTGYQNIVSALTQLLEPAK